MKASRAGFRECEHTADWELEVWAPDFETLVVQAARGMYRLAGARLAEAPRIERRLELTADDPESLLVSFLSELLFLGESEGLAFDQFQLHVTGSRLQAEIGGAPYLDLAKEIKAVTYHQLNIQETERGLNVNIVFDV